jgi:hypothetical protein
VAPTVAGSAAFAVQIEASALGRAVQVDSIKICVESACHFST